MSRSPTPPGDVLVPGEEGPFWRSPTWWWRAGRASAGVWTATVLSFVGTVVAAKTLGPTDYGKVVLAVAVATLISTFLDLTLEEAVVHYGSRALEDGDIGGLRGLLRAAVRTDLALGAMVFGGLILAAGPLADLVGRGRIDPTLIRLAALSSLAFTIDGTTGAALLVARRPDVRAWAMAGTNLLRLGAVAVAAVLFTGPRSILLALALGAGLGSVVQALIAWRVAWRQWSGVPAADGMRAWLRKLLPFGVHSSVTTSVAGGKEALVPIVVGGLIGPTAVGLLDVALLPVSAFAVASGPFRMAILPEQVRLFARGQRDRLRRSVRGYTFIALAVGVPAAVLGWFVLPWLLPALYSDAFRDSVDPARILLVAALAQILVGWGKTLPAAVGRPQVRTMVISLELGLTILLLVVLSGWDLTGAAIALSSSAVIVASAWWLASRRLLREEITPGIGPPGRESP